VAAPGCCRRLHRLMRLLFLHYVAGPLDRSKPLVAPSTLTPLNGVITHSDACTDRLLEQPAIDVDADPPILAREFHTAPFE